MNCKIQNKIPPLHHEIKTKPQIDGTPASLSIKAIPGFFGKTEEYKAKFGFLLTLNCKLPDS
jgi:hypothetical protein